ncbi:hypothetical protein RO3G_02387 [Rhizopus delemar RA 99-880]|uniref:Uncharacterized protein n=1 Tax=Rhizopus delemar (strain RA 99-880 / ATCC MYA-4621 / FGSC 9543 / NRRL 43880) TaxID=246409 RepID=I1BNA3_RHIO9|nr:hypothetical protein RO3G_02387 [Rhizopus delemar RA 99-880]|eukprot:EIE77683.1 hypothetical protein RO3G_02387 [Rhizopus delemar RA 99-880]
MSQIPTSKWSLFWKIPASPEGWSLWYHLFHRKLYSQPLLSRFDNGLTSSQFHTSLSLKTMYAQSSGLFSSFLLLTALTSGLSAAACCLLSGMPPLEIYYCRLSFY